MSPRASSENPNCSFIEGIATIRFTRSM